MEDVEDYELILPKWKTVNKFKNYFSKMKQTYKQMKKATSDASKAASKAKKIMFKTVKDIAATKLKLMVRTVQRNLPGLDDKNIKHKDIKKIRSTLWVFEDEANVALGKKKKITCNRGLC